jgi:hypothetical protein
MEIYCNMGQPTKALIFSKSTHRKLKTSWASHLGEEAKILQKDPQQLVRIRLLLRKQEKFWCRKNELAAMKGALTDPGGLNTAVYVHERPA